MNTQITMTSPTSTELTETTLFTNHTLIEAMNTQLECFENEVYRISILLPSAVSTEEEVQDMSFNEIAYQFERKLKAVIRNNQEGLSVYGGIGVIQCTESGINFVYDFVKGRRAKDHKPAALFHGFYWLELKEGEYIRPKDGLQVKAGSEGNWIISYQDCPYEVDTSHLEQIQANDLRELMNNHYALIEKRITSILRAIRSKLDQSANNAPIVNDTTDATDVDAEETPTQTEITNELVSQD